jgi:phosphoribosylformylglycinamidine synthase PurS subunit
MSPPHSAHIAQVGIGNYDKRQVMRARVFITLKPGVLDPAGKAVEKSLHTLGFGEARDVRIGKFVELDVEAKDAGAAKARVEQMCQKLLANLVVESFKVEIQP